MERYPINLNEYEELAKKILPHNIWDYIEAGRGDEISLKRNTEIYDEVFLRPNKWWISLKLKCLQLFLETRHHFH